MQHCYANNMVDRKLYVIVIVIVSVQTSQSVGGNLRICDLDMRRWNLVYTKENIAMTGRFVPIHVRLCKNTTLRNFIQQLGSMIFPDSDQMHVFKNYIHEHVASGFREHRKELIATTGAFVRFHADWFDLIIVE